MLSLTSLRTLLDKFGIGCKQEELTRFSGTVDVSLYDELSCPVVIYTSEFVVRAKDESNIINKIRNLHDVVCAVDAEFRRRKFTSSAWVNYNVQINKE